MFLRVWAFHYRQELTVAGRAKMALGVLLDGGEADRRAAGGVRPSSSGSTSTTTTPTACEAVFDPSDSGPCRAPTSRTATSSGPVSDGPPPAELPPGELSSDNHLLLPPRFYTGGGKGTAQQQQQKAVDPGCSSRPVTRLRCLDAAACHTTTLPGCRSRPVTRLRCLQLQEVGGEGWKCCLREGLALSRAMRKEAQRYPGLLSKTGTSVQVVHLPPPQVLQLKVSVGQERPPPCHYNRHV